MKNNIKMVLNGDGHLGVGQVRGGLLSPVAHPDYKLAVDGKLVARYIYVTQPNTRADFVLAPATGCCRCCCPTWKPACNTTGTCPPCPRPPR